MKEMNARYTEQLDEMRKSRQQEMEALRQASAES
jgi:hypothetical protein